MPDRGSWRRHEAVRFADGRAALAGATAIFDRQVRPFVQHLHSLQHSPNNFLSAYLQK